MSIEKMFTLHSSWYEQRTSDIQEILGDEIAKKSVKSKIEYFNRDGHLNRSDQIAEYYGARAREEAKMLCVENENIPRAEDQIIESIKDAVVYRGGDQIFLNMLKDRLVRLKLARE